QGRILLFPPPWRSLRSGIPFCGGVTFGTLRASISCIPFWTLGAARGRGQEGNAKVVGAGGDRYCAWIWIPAGIGEGDHDLVVSHRQADAHGGDLAGKNTVHAHAGAGRKRSYFQRAVTALGKEACA